MKSNNIDLFWRCKVLEETVAIFMESKSECPLLGIAADRGFTVDEFLARKHEEKVLEGE